MSVGGVGSSRVDGRSKASIRASDTNRLDKIIKKAGSVLGLRLESFESVVERRTLKKTVIHH